MAATQPIFEVPRLNVFGSRLLARRGAMMERIGRLETDMLSDQLRRVDTSWPIFVCGLARSGTTILLELLSQHRDVASQRYLDYPFVFTPYLWNRYLGFARRGPAPAAERAHRDGLVVSAESPEAMEEPIWMRFFPRAHDPSVSNVLGQDTRHPAFESFYDSHMAKLLFVRGRTRYVAKGNYHVARIGYLARLYPEARFLIPVRAPAMQVASSIKQQRLFAKGQAENRDARLYLAQAGHFEFGLDRAPINVDAERTRRVIEQWERGDEVGGWALYWATIHDHIADMVASDPALRERVVIVPYENTCADAGNWSERIAAFCGLPSDPDFTAFAAGRLKEQHYYRPDFSDDDLAQIRTITAPAAERMAALVAA